MNYYREYIGIKSILYFCSLPLRLDTYKGCEHACVYCFSQSLNNRKGNFFVGVVPADIRKFPLLFENRNSKNISLSPIRSCLAHRIPIHIGCISDPLQPKELEYRNTQNVLQILINNRYPCVISTKSKLIAENPYLSLIQQLPIVVQISFSTLDNNLASKLEPNAPNPSERLKIIELLASNNIFVAVRFQPFLYPKENIIEDYYRIISSSGAKHVMLEHLRIPINSNKRQLNKLSNILGYDVIQKYRDMGIKCSRINYELASEIKLPNIMIARHLAHKYQLSFGSADNDFHHFSDNVCCCGVVPNKDFKNIYKAHIGYSIYKGIRNNHIKFDNLNKEWQIEGSIKEYINSDCRKRGVNQVIDLMNDKINRPKSSNSPSKFYGIIYNGKSYQISKSIRKLLKKGE